MARKRKLTLEKILFIPDVHVPYHDKKAFELVLKVAHAFKPKWTIVLGDFADFYAVSSHSKDPRRALKLKEEVVETQIALAKLRAIGAAKNVFVAGNHEDRLERYLCNSAPELYEFLDIPSVLRLREMGFSYVPYKQAFQLGKLKITHDTGNAGRYAHYKSLDTFQHNVIIGHTHRLGYAVEGNATGERHVTAMFGWLGDVKMIDYMHQVKAAKEWTLGFGIGYYCVQTGAVYVVPIPIVKYTCVVEGRLFQV